MRKIAVFLLIAGLVFSLGAAVPAYAAEHEAKICKTSKCNTFTFDGRKSYDCDCSSCLTYAWDFGDGTTSTEPVVTHTYEKGGEYTVTLTVKDNSGLECDTDVTTEKVTVNTPPVAAFTAPEKACCGTEVTFDASSTTDDTPGNISYCWNFGDGTTGDGKVVTHTYNKSGSYKVVLNVDDGAGSACSTDCTSKCIAINAGPTADAGCDIERCVRATKGQEGGYAVCLDGSKSCDPENDCLTYAWDFGDGEKGEGAKVNHNYKNGGSYTATLTVDDGSGLACSTSTDTVSIKLQAAPIAVATGTEKICVGQDASFDGSGSSVEGGRALKYLWTFGDGATGEGVNVTHKYEKSGKHNVVLTVDDGLGTACSKAMDARCIYVNAGPTADAGCDVDMCIKACPGEGMKVMLDGSRSCDPENDCLTYKWDLGDGETAEGAKVCHVYKAGTYTATLTVDDGSGLACSSSTDTVSIRLVEAPIAAATGPEQVCVGEEAMFDGSGSSVAGGRDLKYSWCFGDGATGEGVKASHKYEKGGKYNVTLTIDDGLGTACSCATASTCISVNAGPTADAGCDVDMCIKGCPGEGAKITLDGSRSCDPDGNKLCYTWDFGDGETAEGAKVCHVYKAGTYTATLTVDDGSGLACSTSTDTVSIRLVEPPVAVAKGPECACVGESLTFDGSESGVADNRPLKYTWDFGDGETGEGETVAHTYQCSGTRKVTLMVDDGLGTACSKACATTCVTLNGAPTVSLPEMCDLCLDQCKGVAFKANACDPDGDKLCYTWDFGDGCTETAGASVRHTYTQGGHYTVSVVVDDGKGTPCSTASTATSFNINSAPTAAFEICKKCCVGMEQKFDAAKSNDPEGDALKYMWDFGDGETAEGANAVHTYTKPGTYKVVLTVDDGKGTHCSCSTACETICINAAPTAVIEVK